MRATLGGVRAWARRNRAADQGVGPQFSVLDKNDTKPNSTGD
jgi:hypothetical protein